MFEHFVMVLGLFWPPKKWRQKTTRGWHQGQMARRMRRERDDDDERSRDEWHELGRGWNQTQCILVWVWLVCFCCCWHNDPDQVLPIWGMGEGRMLRRGGILPTRRWIRVSVSPSWRWQPFHRTRTPLKGRCRYSQLTGIASCRCCQTIVIGECQQLMGLSYR